jgi:hypothetical protein
MVTALATVDASWRTATCADSDFRRNQAPTAMARRWLWASARATYDDPANVRTRRGAREREAARALSET